MTESKDACSRVVAVSKAYGFVNEWGPHYSERFRSSRCVFVGSADTTVCATILRKADGSATAAYCGFFSWSEGQLEGYNSFMHLKFSMEPEFSCRWDRDKPTWYHEGESVQLTDLVSSQNYAAAENARMIVPGLPALASLVVRSHLLAQAFQSRRFLVNEPMLWVPRRKVEAPVNMVEHFLAYICAGIGPMQSPAYLQANEVVRDAFGIGTWDMFFRSGCRPEVMMRDLGAKTGVLGKFCKIIKKFIEEPIAMSGIQRAKLPLLLSKAEQQAFAECVPWFCEDSDGYEPPDHKECFLVARRTDTVLLQGGAYIPAKFLGFSAPCEEELRQKMHLAEVSRQQAPVIEVKPVEVSEEV